MSPAIRLLACGAIDRGDDAVALHAMRGLPGAAREAARIEEVGYLSPEQLIGDAPHTRRLVVDCVAGLAAGAIVDVSLAELPALEREAGATSTHALAPGAAVAIAARLGAVRPDDRFVGIGGVSFEPGDGLSPAVWAGLPALIMRIAERVREAARCA